MRNVVFLSSAQRAADFALLLLRVFVGLFLVWAVWDNVTSGERMREFAEFLGKHGFTSPNILAPVSVYLQLAMGIAFILGLFTRWAGLLCAIHFVVAIVMVDHVGGMRGIFPSGCLVVIGLYLATRGAGRFSVDAALHAERSAADHRQRAAEIVRNVPSTHGAKHRNQGAHRECRAADAESGGARQRRAARNRAGRHRSSAANNGRLKLRASSTDAGELIFYRRVNQAGPKESFYIQSPTSSPETLRESLSLAYGQIGRIRKYRTLFLVGRTRVHLDRVEGLGHFLELEVVLVDDESPNRQFVRQVTSWIDSEFSPNNSSKARYLDLMLAPA